MAVFLAMMVMPFSRSRSMESITLSFTCSLARKMPLCQSIASTRVVLPWSTWAMMARLRTSSRVCKVKTLSPFGDRARPGLAAQAAHGQGLRAGLGARPLSDRQRRIQVDRRRHDAPRTGPGRGRRCGLEGGREPVAYVPLHGLPLLSDGAATSNDLDFTCNS